MLLLYLLLLSIAGYIFLKRRFTYWRRRGISEIEPELFFGNLRKLLMDNVPLSQIVKEAYNEFRVRKKNHGGMYLTHTPLWMPIDLNLIKRILITDFDYFNSHGFYHHKDDIFTIQLFSIEGTSWRELRSKLTPTFSSAKLRLMFDMINSLGQRITDKVAEYSENSEAFEIRELMACFGIDVVASCFFGIESDCFNDPHNDFMQKGRLVFKPRPLAFFLEQTLNWNLLAFLGYKFAPKEAIMFFTDLIGRVSEYREANNISRNDYLDLLLRLKNKGTVEGEKDTNATGVLTFNDVVANAFMMYSAGFETSATTTSFLMYELSKNQEIQEKARQEIQKVLGSRSASELTYEDIAELKYCEMCIKEALRLYPVLSDTPRQCIKTYRIPGTNQVIEKGTFTIIPAWSIHMDPEYYPDPNTFNPENFNTENEKARPELTFLGFGGGPRLCIGFRFALMQIKIVLVRLLSAHKFTLNPKTPHKLSYLASTFVLTSKESLWLDITPLK